jgi:hypothetical protein
MIQVKVEVATMNWLTVSFILSYISNTNTTCSFEFNLKGTFTSKIDNDKNHRNRTTGRATELMHENCIKWMYFYVLNQYQ